MEAGKRRLAALEKAKKKGHSAATGAGPNR
jgi:hypothetical protein